MVYDLLLRNCKIPEGDLTVSADIAVKDGKIAAILTSGSDTSAKTIIDIIEE